MHRTHRCFFDNSHIILSTQTVIHQHVSERKQWPTFPPAKHNNVQITGWQVEACLHTTKYIHLQTMQPTVINACRPS